MTQGKDAPTSRYCPRCGGLMVKPPGSSLYWHADNNHPRCDITNIVETSLTVQAPDMPPDQPSTPTPKGKNKK